MARNVIISLLGSAPYCLPYQEDLDHLVTEMERHWEKELSQVLCSKPDLIVVPEACDRYPNFTIEERLRYYEAREGRVRDFFAEICRRNHCNIAYSAARRLPDRPALSVMACPGLCSSTIPSCAPSSRRPAS